MIVLTLMFDSPSRSLDISDKQEMGEYKLEHDSLAHASLLRLTMQSWSNPQSDVYIISREGHKVFTNR